MASQAVHRDQRTQQLQHDIASDWSDDDAFAGSTGLALAIAAALGGGVFADQPDTTRNPLANDAAAATAGRRSTISTCQSCHGPAGQGDRGPALNTTRFARGGADGDLFHTIRAGVPGTQMPPFAGLADTQIWQIVSYIRSLAASPAARPAPKIPVAVTTRDGRELRGTRLNEDTFTVQFVDAAGAVHLFDKSSRESLRRRPRKPPASPRPGRDTDAWRRRRRSRRTG